MFPYFYIPIGQYLDTYHKKGQKEKWSNVSPIYDCLQRKKTHNLLTKDFLYKFF